MPDLVLIQTICVLKKILKDKDAPLFKLEFWGFDPFFEIGGTYVTSEGLLCFRKDAKKIFEWI